MEQLGITALKLGEVFSSFKANYQQAKKIKKVMKLKRKGVRYNPYK